MPAPTDEPLSVLTATSAAAGIVGRAGPAPAEDRPPVDALTRQIEAEVQSLAVILNVAEGDPLDAPLVTIELACLRIRDLGR
jgi:hypothetical protein